MRTPVNILRAPKIKCLGHVITKRITVDISEASCSCGFFVAAGKQQKVRDAVQKHIHEILTVRDEEAKPTARERKLERLLRAAQRFLNDLHNTPADRLSQRISRAIVR